MKRNFFYSAIFVAGILIACSAGSKVYGQTTQSTASVEKSLKYTCPMHAEVVVDKAGTCPKCGMDLVAKKDKSSGTKSEKNDSTGVKSDHSKMMKDSTSIKEDKPMMEKAPSDEDPMKTE